MLRNSCLLVSCMLLAFAATSSTAFAQFAPPQPSVQGSYSPILGYVVLAILGSIVVAISLYPSKRSHQDV